CVSVLMPVYNVEQYLHEAIKSILYQTYSNWEVIIADDGSTDSSAEIAATFAASDPRIKVTTFPHRGLVATLNSAMRLCGGRYVFRMDADDVALPRRLECQTRYLDSHPETVVLGCAV